MQRRESDAHWTGGPSIPGGTGAAGSALWPSTLTWFGPVMAGYRLEMDDKERREKLVQFLKDARMAMLVTINDHGEFESRPMAIQEAEFDGDLWFFAYDSSTVFNDISQRPQVNVAVSDDKHQAWLSISGTASPVHDRAKAEQLWSPFYKTYFPEGLDTPGLALIKVEATSAQYWDAPGSKLVQLLGMAKGLITGREADVGETETLPDL
jgi:general stress protein 26